MDGDWTLYGNADKPNMIDIVGECQYNRFVWQVGSGWLVISDDGWGEGTSVDNPFDAEHFRTTSRAKEWLDNCRNSKWLKLNATLRQIKFSAVVVKD